MERRGQQNLNREHCSCDNGRSVVKYHELPKFKHKLNSWTRIGLSAKKKETVFSNLFCHINVENLRQAFRSIDGSKASGIDGISKKDYEKNLEANLLDLETRLQRGTYRPQDKREINIPKSNGKTRPIAIGCFEDKLVEWVLGKILESVYEPLFINNSFGFRPKKSAHQAIEASYMILKDNKRPFVAEIDLAQFFNTVSHRKLMGIIGDRITDARLHGLISRFLRVGILKETGETVKTEVGTPQGSIMSPILANIYLNEVLDQWFKKNLWSQEAVMVRYADDAVFMFSQEEKAKEFLKLLKERLARYELSLNEDKTGIINFSKEAENIFSFLGFTFYWAKKWWSKKRSLVVKTQKEKLRKKIQEFTDWIKTNRSRLKLKEILATAAAKLSGHYNYYGYYCNRKSLVKYYYFCTRNLFKWLNRRSQRKTLTWKKFKRRLSDNPLPFPKPMSELKSLGWNPYVK